MSTVKGGDKLFLGRFMIMRQSDLEFSSIEPIQEQKDEQMGHRIRSGRALLSYFH